MARSDSSLSHFLTGLIIGFLSGGVLALLLSPQSGQENRKTVKRAASTLSDSVKNEVQNPYGNTQRFIEKQRYYVEKQWQKLQSQLKSTRLEKAKQREEAFTPEADDVDAV
ncbi:MAG: YtxH domain-containing protein [Vampirovibrionales bacterium]